MRDVPVPPHARVDVGAEAQGVDEGASFVAFVSDLAPEGALAGYDDLLRASGFRADGDHNGWRRYHRGDTQIALSIASDGPPTLMVVRIEPVTTPAPDPSGGTPLPTSEAPSPSGPPPAPPATAAPAVATDVPRASERPQLATPEPQVKPGGNPHWTPPGQGGTPPGQGGTPPGQGGKPPEQGGNPGGGNPGGGNGNDAGRNSPPGEGPQE